VVEVSLALIIGLTQLGFLSDEVHMALASWPAMARGYSPT
jgi:hypothetical protein